MYDLTKRNLKQLILNKAVLHGEFKLASGGTSSYFLDTKRVTMDSAGASLVGLMMRKSIHPFTNVIGGMETGAIPIIISVLVTYHYYRDELKSFFVRKQPKTTGTETWIEGIVEEGTNISLLEDVVTKGNSVLKAAERLKKEYPESRIVKIVSLIDRLEGGREKIEEAGYKYESLFTIKELGLL